jgi:hypothetical protein
MRFVGKAGYYDILDDDGDHLGAVRKTATGWMANDHRAEGFGATRRAAVEDWTRAVAEFEERQKLKAETEAATKRVEHGSSISLDLENTSAFNAFVDARLKAAEFENGTIPYYRAFLERFNALLGQYTPYEGDPYLRNIEKDREAGAGAFRPAEFDPEREYDELARFVLLAGGGKYLGHWLDARSYVAGELRLPDDTIAHRRATVAEWRKRTGYISPRKDAQVRGHVETHFRHIGATEFLFMRTNVKGTVILTVKAVGKEPAIRHNIVFHTAFPEIYHDQMHARCRCQAKITKRPDGTWWHPATQSIECAEKDVLMYIERGR